MKTNARDGPSSLTIDFDPTGRITVVAGSLDLLGQSGTARGGTPFPDLFIPADRLQLADWLASPETATTLRLSLTRGLLPPLPCHVTLLRLAPGQAGRAVLNDAAAAEDVARLRAERDHFAHYVDETWLGTWAWNVQTGETRFNERWAGIVGYRLAELAPISIETWLQLCHPDDLARSNHELQRHFAGETEWYEVEVRMRRKDGRWIWVRDVGRLQSRDAQGRPEWMYGVHRNIDAVKAREGQLRRVQGLLEKAGALAGFGCWELDVRTQEIYWSDETCRIHGMPPGTVPPLEKAIAFYAPEARPIVAAAVEAAMQHGTPWQFELPLIRADGTRIWVVSLGEAQFEDGLPVRIAGAFQDITARKESERKLAEAATEVQIAHERLNTIAQNVPGALFELRREADGRIGFPYFTRKFAELLGVPDSIMAAGGPPVFRNIPRADFEAVQNAFLASRQSLSLLEARHRVMDADGETRWVNLWASPSAQPDGAVHWFGKALDITDRLQIEAQVTAAAEEVRLAHARIASILDIVPVGLFEFRLHPDGRTDFPYTSGRFGELVGRDRAEIARLGGALLAGVLPEDRPAMEELTRISAAELTPWRMRFRYAHPERGMIWLMAASIPEAKPDGTVIWTGALYDATPDVTRESELERAYALAEQMRNENEHLALHDGLTRLPNRRYFDRHIEARLHAAEAGHGPRDCVLIQVDLDHFKHVNDTLGHAAGDQVLIRVADLLRRNLQADDFAARLGGDEFCLLLAPGTTEMRARAIVERLRRGLDEPLRYRGHPCRISASFGVVIAEDMTDLAEELQLYADAALYRAKTAGRDRVEIFAHALAEQMHLDRQLAAHFHWAFEKNEFEPWFQPQVRTSDMSLVGVEVLVRWRHPERGLMTPEAFLRVARELQIVAEIDRVVMEKTAEVLDRLEGAGIVLQRVSFNVCAGRLRDPSLPLAARKVARDRTRVALELLETGNWQEEGDDFREALARLRAQGIEIEIDDFGSGQTSIVGLMEIRPSALKIDRRIVAAMRRDTQDAGLVRQIVQIARSLGITTIAEGVETAAQAETLRAIGCDRMQGFFIAPPLDEARLRAFMMARQSPVRASGGAI
ncbi:sensor domain-containing protein [Rhodobacter viridis]|uniref:sensor domain-containing protein n=1 Tax=Rhodobacter viridis TaxID=1054202 RepID=UPI0015E8C485|nr:EAL domain-containing protein [Rhodobacter viridis]